METNKRRQGHLWFTTEPKQSTKGHRQLPGNTIPTTAGSGVEQNINHFQLHLTKVPALQCCSQTAVWHVVRSLWFTSVFPAITSAAWWEGHVSCRYVCTATEILVWGYYFIFWPHFISLLNSEYNICLYCVESICFQWGACVNGLILCSENSFGSECPQSESRGMSACCSAWRKSVCHLPKCSFSRQLQLQQCFCRYNHSHIHDLIVCLIKSLGWSLKRSQLIFLFSHENICSESNEFEPEMSFKLTPILGSDLY